MEIDRTSENIVLKHIKIVKQKFKIFFTKSQFATSLWTYRTFNFSSQLSRVHYSKHTLETTVVLTLSKSSMKKFTEIPAKS